MLDQDQGGSC